MTRGVHPTPFEKAAQEAGALRVVIAHTSSYHLKQLAEERLNELGYDRDPGSAKTPPPWEPQL